MANGVEFRIMPSDDEGHWYWEVLKDGREVVARGVADTEPAACEQANEAARLAFEYPTYVISSLSILFSNVCPIAHQSTIGGPISTGIGRRQFVTGSKIDKKVTPRGAAYVVCTIRPQFERRAKLAKVRSISSPSARELMELNSTPKDVAANWIAPHWPLPAALLGSRSTATCRTAGATSLSSSSRFRTIP